MITCPKCRKTYNDGVELCQEDGAVLTQLKQETLVGQTINGRYRVIAELGRGGMGAVYLAEQITFGRKVALKVLHEKYAWDEDVVQRFRREARLTATLSHPNVITVHDFDQSENGTLFIAMEYVDGGTLRQVLQRGPLALEEAARISLQIAEGLRAAHRLGVIHRDVKPENILVSHNAKQVKVTDLGVARIRDAEGATRLTQTGIIVGTPAYMAPEQIEGRELTAQTDIYAFGIMLYEMLSGNTPFTASSSTALLMKHIRETPVPLRVHRGEVPVSLERLVMQMLEKVPEQRPRDMDEVLADLIARHSGDGNGTIQRRNWRGEGSNCVTEASSVAPEAFEAQGSRHQELPITVALPGITRSKKAAGLWLGGIATIMIAALVIFSAFSGVNFLSFRSAVALNALSIQSSKYEMETGETVLVRAQGRYTDGKEIVLSDGVRWESSNPAIFVISPDGRLEGRLPGSADIIARFGDVAAPLVAMKIKEKATPEPPLVEVEPASVVIPPEELPPSVKEKNKIALRKGTAEKAVRGAKDRVEHRPGGVSEAYNHPQRKSEGQEPRQTTNAPGNPELDAQALNNKVQGKQNEEQTPASGKSPGKEELQSVTKSSRQSVERPITLQVEVPAPIPSPDRIEAAPAVPARTARDVVADYIRGEKQRRGR